MQDKYILGSAGIIVIGLMETAAILTGHDGAYMSLCVGAIAGIIGAIAGLTVNITKKQ